MKHVSDDGLAQSNDASLIETWNSIGRDMRNAERAWIARLMAHDVKLAHPDDGWVDRVNNVLNPCYPQFNLHPQVGNLIALGWPDKYRIVVVVEVQRRRGIVIPDKDVYRFKET